MDLTVRRGSSLYPWETENPFIGSAWKPDWRKWITGNMSVPAVIMLQRCYRTRPEGWGWVAVKRIVILLLFHYKFFLLSFFNACHIHTHKSCTRSTYFTSVMTFMCWRVKFTVVTSHLTTSSQKILLSEAGCNLISWSFPHDFISLQIFLVVLILPPKHLVRIERTWCNEWWRNRQ